MIKLDSYVRIKTYVYDEILYLIDSYEDRIEEYTEAGRGEELIRAYKEMVRLLKCLYIKAEGEDDV